MIDWDELAIDYLIAVAKGDIRGPDKTYALSKAERVAAEHRLFRYVAAMRNPKATKAQIAANARVIDEAARAAAIEVEVVDEGAS